MLLSAYLTKVQRILHDSAGVFWSTSELTDYINSATAHVAADTGCLRALVSTLPNFTVTNATWASNAATYTIGSHKIQVGTLITVTGMNPSGYNVTNAVVTAVAVTTVTIALASNPGAFVSGGTLVAQLTTIAAQETYSFPTVTVTVAANATPTTNQASFAVLNVNILQGAVRYSMRYAPWTAFNAQLRAWQNYMSLPLFASIYNENTLYLAPVPDQAYPMEWDVVYMPPTLVATTDDDTLIYPYTEAVPYYASYLAQLGKQRYQEAQTNLVLYSQKLNQITDEVTVRRVPNPYFR